MSFQRPTLTQLISRINADLATRLIGTPNALRRSVVGVLSIVWGGALYLVYGFLSWIALQVIPDTAEDEYLVRWASIKNITPIPATFQTGTVTFTAGSGTTILSGTPMQADDGTQYKATADTPSSGGFCVVPVLCSVSGAIGKRTVADNITLLSPIAGITSLGSWTSTSVIGTDQESQTSLQARMLVAFRTPPQGGSNADYNLWATQVSGVTRVWVFNTWLGGGTVGVTFVRDNDGTGSAIIPNGAAVAAVQAYITDSTRAPVTANVTVFAPTAVVINFTIHLSPDTAALRASVISELTNLIYREAVPGQTLYLSHIQAAIREGLGTGDFSFTVPAANVVLANNQIGIMGTVTWT